MNPELFVMVTLALAALVIISVIVKMSKDNPNLYSVRSAAVLFLMALTVMMLVSIAIELDKWENSDQEVAIVE